MSLEISKRKFIPRSKLSEALGVYELKRSVLINILRDGSQHMRPPRLDRQEKVDLIDVVERALLSANFRIEYTRLLKSYVWEWEEPPILKRIMPVGRSAGFVWSYPSEQDGYFIQTGVQNDSGRVMLRILLGDKVEHVEYHERADWAASDAGKLIIDRTIAKHKADAATEGVGAAVADI